MNEQEFYEKIEEWISNPDLSSWNHVTLFAYFCYKYEKVHNIRFRPVRSKRGPSSTKETRDFNRLFYAFAPDNYKELDSESKKPIREKVNRKILDYINWMFDYKFRHKTDAINGTHLFMSPAIQNEFERMYQKHLRKKAAQERFNVLLQWCKANHPSLLESHQMDKSSDLMIIEKYCEAYNLDESTPEASLISKAKELGIL